jgi:hypothetical protein
LILRRIFPHQPKSPLDICHIARTHRHGHLPADRTPLCARPSTIHDLPLRQCPMSPRKSTGARGPEHHRRDMAVGDQAVLRGHFLLRHCLRAVGPPRATPTRQ